MAIFIRVLTFLVNKRDQSRVLMRLCRLNPHSQSTVDTGRVSAIVSSFAIFGYCRDKSWLFKSCRYSV